MEIATNSSSRSPELYDRHGLYKVPYNLVMGIAIFFFNSTQAYVFATMKRQSFSNVLFLFIAISDAMFGAMAVPIFTVNQIFLVWPLGKFMCYLNLVLLGLNFSVSNYWLFMLSFNRLLHLVTPYSDHEKITFKKTIILLLPIFIITVYNLLNLLGHVLANKFNPSTCSLDINKYQLLAQAIAMYSGPAVLSVITNVTNIILLYKKRTSNTPLNSSIYLAKSRIKLPNSSESKCSMPEPQESGYELVPLKLKQNPGYAEKRSSAGNSTIYERPLYNRTLSNRVNKDKRAVLCIGMLVANAVLTQSITSVLYPLIFFCHCAYNLFNFGLGLAYAFPLVNPILVFIFHESFRKEWRLKLRGVFGRSSQ